MRSVAFLSLSLASFALAKDISVSVSSFVFTPDNIQADAGDTVIFVFDGTPGKHSVVQSNFTNPCAPLSGGFDSGFVTVAANATAPFMEYKLSVTNASAPIWFYCAQTAGPKAHCLNGMVGVINQNSSSTKTIDTYRAAAVALSTLPDQGSAGDPAGGVNVKANGAPAVGQDAAASVSGIAATSTAPVNTATAGSGSSSGSNTATGPQTTNTGAASPSKLSGLAAAVAAVALGVAL